jgi:hypothetical protein
VTSIYGSRGAKWVAILITTKTGKAGASYIQVETSWDIVALTKIQYGKIRIKYIALGWEVFIIQGVIYKQFDPTAYATNLFFFCQKDWEVVSIILGDVANGLS